MDDGDRAAIIDMLARLHTAAPKGIKVPSRPLELAARQAIASVPVANPVTPEVQRAKLDTVATLARRTWPRS